MRCVVVRCSVGGAAEPPVPAAPCGHRTTLKAPSAAAAADALVVQVAAHNRHLEERVGRNTQIVGRRMIRLEVYFIHM